MSAVHRAIVATKTCIVCGGTFERPPGRSQAQWDIRRVCSQTCTAKLPRKQKPVQLRLPKTKREHVEKDGTRLCSRCATRKPLSEFPMKGKQRNGAARYAYCRPCHSKYQRELKLANIFGLTPDESVQIEEYQGQRCAICRRPPSKVRLATDHSHKTGLVRGKLCWICNRLLGMVADDPTRLRAAAAYLEDPPAVRALGREVYGRKGKTTNKAKRRRKKKAEEPPAWQLGRDAA